jgi:hypothetical protein
VIELVGVVLDSGVNRHTPIGDKGGTELLGTVDLLGPIFKEYEKFLQLIYFILFAWLLIREGVDPNELIPERFNHEELLDYTVYVTSR